MVTTARPRRSVLYMPGSNPRALEKAKGLAADGLIFDLEDAVAPDAKDEARTLVTSAAASAAYGKREIIIRVNGADTPWAYADLAAVARSGADAILLPKVESADAVRIAGRILAAHGAPDDLAIWCMMETPFAILHAEEIAAAPRVAVLVMGTSDLAKDTFARHTPERLPMLTSLNTCVLAARAHGLAVLDGVYLDLNDEAGFAAACTQGVELGFDGKTLIHPKTIAAANAAFAPSVEGIAWARRIIAAYEDAAAAGKGVVVVEGHLIERLHVAEAERQVRLADAIKDLEESLA